MPNITNPIRQNDLDFLNYWLINGHNALKAYRKVHPDCSNETAKVNGCRILTKTNVKAEIARLQAETKAESVATRDKRKQFWTSTMNNKDAQMPDRLRASELLGKSECDFISVVLTDPDQARELSESEARLGLELIRLRRQLKYGVVEAELVSGPLGGQPVAERPLDVEEQGPGLKEDEAPKARPSGNV